MTGETIAPHGEMARPLQAEAQLRSTTRLLYIDNLRVGLIVLVIVGHMAISYGAPLGSWYYHGEGEVGPLFAIGTLLLLGIGAAFLMGLFYMIAGYFTPRTYDRKGAWRFTGDRLVRLGIPLLFYALLINPLVTYVAAVHGGYEGSFWQYVPTHVPDLQRAAVGPLWFVAALLVFSLVYALARVMTTGRGLSVRPEAGVPGNRVILLFALGLGLATFCVRIWAPMGWWWEPLHQEPGHWPQYVALFAAGILAYRGDWFARFPARQARIWGWVALACVPLLPALAVAAGALRGEFDPAVAGGLTWLSLAYSLWEGLIGVALAITVLVWARERLDRAGALLQKMAAASYATYILHPLVIVPLVIALSGIALAPGLKFVLVTPAAVALCFLVGYGAKQLPVVRKIL